MRRAASYADVPGILAEGEAANRSDLVYLEKLPLFDAAGNPLD